jgi:hypothetical protein
MTVKRSDSLVAGWRGVVHFNDKERKQGSIDKSQNTRPPFHHGPTVTTTLRRQRTTSVRPSFAQGDSGK